MLKYAHASAILTTLLLTGCSQKPSDAPATGRLASNDFENVDGWLADSPALETLNRDKAHSGVYSTMVSPGHDYSLGYSNLLGRLSPEWPAKLTIGAWVMLPNSEANPRLVIEVKRPNNNGPNLVWEAVELAREVKAYNQWQYVERTITMPDAAKPNSRLLVYMWSTNNKAPVYLDDLHISLARR